MEKLEVLASITRLSSNVVRVLGQNPGKFQLQGTNTYIVGKQNPYTLIDTGEGKAEYIPVLESALRETVPLTDPNEPHVSDIVISHWHHDHVGGLPDVLSLLRKLWDERSSPTPFKPPRLHKFPFPSNDEPDRSIVSSIIQSLPPGSFTPTPEGKPFHDIFDSQVLSAKSTPMKVLHTPGHTADSICLYIPEDKALYTADTVLGQGTAVFEDLSAYINSLRKMLDFHSGPIDVDIHTASIAPTYQVLYPGHGPVVSEGAKTIEMYINHRLQREKQVLQVLDSPSPSAKAQGSGGESPRNWTTWDVVTKIYAEYPENLWLPAAHGIDLHMKKLEKDGAVRKKCNMGPLFLNSIEETVIMHYVAVSKKLQANKNKFSPPGQPPLLLIMADVAASPAGREDLSSHKRKRSRSPSSGLDADLPPSTRRRSYSPPNSSSVNLPKVSDADPARRAERERQLAARVAAMELEKAEKDKEVGEKDKEKEKEFDDKAEFAKLVSTRSGGVYMPPARLRALQAAAAQDKSSTEYQRLSWDALRKSITGIVNRVNITNIKQVVPELFSENLIRGRGLFARSVMKAQAASLPFTPVFAALVAIINSKLPQVGELVLTRLISQFRRAYKRNDKTICHSTTTFIAHLINQGVAHEIIALQILILLLERPTDDSVEIAVGFMREVGAYLSEHCQKANTSVFERFRATLNEGTISHRVQYMIEVLMQVRKDKFKDNPILPEGLDLVEEDEQITHQIQLEEELQIQEGLNIFKLDPKYLENEEKYKAIKSEILGEDSDEESGSEESSDDESDEEGVEEKEGIEDKTETNLVNLRRTIYLTIMNALNYEEAVHKLLKVQLKEGQEIELINMVIECSSQERSYSTFYGLIGERFSKLNRVWTECFETAFGNYYETIHRYETNRLRNISRFFGHLLATDAISWAVFECIKVNEEDTTSSSRIFIKILMQEMMESMGLKALAERFKDPEVKKSCEGMFPMDIPKNTRFSINYFTSIGLGVITEEMREYLKNAPRLIMEQRRAMLEAESSSSDSSSDTDTSSDSSSDSDSSSASDSSADNSRRGSHRRPSRRSPPPRRSRTPPIRRRRSVSRDSEASRGPSRRGRSLSRTPPRRRERDDTPPRSERNGDRRMKADYASRDRMPRSPPPLWSKDVILVEGAEMIPWTVNVTVLEADEGPLHRQGLRLSQSVLHPKQDIMVMAVEGEGCLLCQFPHHRRREGPDLRQTILMGILDRVEIVETTTEMAKIGRESGRDEFGRDRYRKESRSESPPRRDRDVRRRDDSRDRGFKDANGPRERDRDRETGRRSPVGRERDRERVR
ncbi:hypothetical protein D9758_009416 [Tetrapyrgos nigripes]|uniref:MI domain-containing protein n=1 Tax=Tetrapyrgos nigripes TaxID=182062 RepID=A0A8H5D1Q6_9AGAR|nr:hypothetical protein D9758_009416 [Tetrapyrgos nigripes]